ncbi:branched-chain amino acid ABC transporter permease [Nonomuraea sp. NPDC048916]|uniref:branched-chain amino acid ABC transporter permease n=1 Tax=Nonomuraea sp. NPDC048916 TaxID=3154232 RepID=UPI00340C5789
MRTVMAVPSVVRGRAGRLLVPLAVVVVLAALPLVLGAYPITLASRVLAFALLVVSVDILTGVTGLPTLGQVAYFGAGAYTAALVGIHWTSNAAVQLLAGVLVATALALATGAIVVRTKGIVFLMVTLAVGELTHQVAASWTAVGGTNGLAGIPPISVLPGGPALTLSGFVYWWVLAVFVVVFLLVARAMRAPFGRTLRGIRDNEPRLRALGQRTYSAKLAAYGLAGAVAGAAGTLWTAQARFVSPTDLGFDVAAFALLSVVIGGAGSLWGPCLGAALVILVRDEVSDYVDGRGPLLLGIVFVAGVYLLPRVRAVLGRLRAREKGFP